MLFPIRLRNSLRFSRHTLLPQTVNPRITSAQSHLYYYYSTDTNRSETNRSDRNPTNDPSPPTPVPNVSETNALPSTAWGQGDAELQEAPEDAEHQRQMQAPNRRNVWSRSQERREVAMRGPRFEQTIMELQPQPQAAIELIHKQPVRWTNKRVVSCDGGGGPLGHPRIYMNVDKPQIHFCTYCGLPWAQEHHREYLHSLPSTSYPLEPIDDSVEVRDNQRVTDEPFAQR